MFAHPSAPTYRLHGFPHSRSAKATMHAVTPEPQLDDSARDYWHRPGQLHAPVPHNDIRFGIQRDASFSKNLSQPGRRQELLRWGREGQKGPRALVIRRLDIVSSL